MGIVAHPLWKAKPTGKGFIGICEKDGVILPFFLQCDFQQMDESRLYLGYAFDGAVLPELFRILIPFLPLIEDRQLFFSVCMAYFLFLSDLDLSIPYLEDLINPELTSVFAVLLTAVLKKRRILTADYNQ